MTKQILKARDYEVEDGEIIADSVECPECSNTAHYNTAHYMAGTSTYVCPECDWESADIDNIELKE